MGHYKRCSFRFELVSSLLFVYFLVYGYFGAFSLPHQGSMQTLALIVDSLVILPPLLIFIFGEKLIKRKRLSIEFTSGDFITFFCISVLTIALLFDRLQVPLFSDELSYSWSSVGHSRSIVMFASKLLPLKDVEFKILVQILNTLLIFSLLSIWYFTNKLDLKYAAGLLFLTMVFCRVAFALKGGNLNPHPPLELVPLLLSSTIFGLNPFGFKIGYLLTFILLVQCACQFLLKDKTHQVLAILFFLSFPITLLYASSVEHSLWGAGFSFLIITYLHKDGEVDWPILFSIVGLGILFRQSIVVFVFPLFLLYFSRQKSKLFSLNGLFRSWQDLYPCVIFVPFLIRSLLFGTPVTEGVFDASLPLPRTFELPSVSQIDLMNQIFPLVYFLGILFCFSLSLRGRNDLKFFLLITFLLNVLMYSGTSIEVWENPKYVFDWCMPYVVFGMLLCTISLSKLVSRNALIALMVVLTATNLIVFEHLPARVFKWFPNFDYGTVMAEIRKQEGIGKTIVIGPTYGVLKHTIYGGTVEEVVAAEVIYNSWQKIKRLGIDGKGLANELDLRQDVEFLVISSSNGSLIEPKRFFLQTLIEMGWKKVEESNEKKSPQRLFLFQKKPQSSR